MSNQIGDRIARYRKAKGLTQEQLGDIVGVSGQAVSKWENGGVPDTLLLPDIAKALGVTTDTLFGIQKKVGDMDGAEICDLAFRFCRHRKIYDKTFAFFEFLFDLLWSTQCGYYGNETLCTFDTVVDEHADNPQITSQIIRDDGTSYLSIVRGFPFFCAVKDDPVISEKILQEENFSELFSLFADKDAFQAIIFTQTSTKTNQYTAEAMAENIGISLEKFEQLAPKLIEYGLLNADSLSINDQTVTVYRKWSNPEIRPMLMMAYQFMHARQCYYDFTCERSKPYFEMKR